MTISLAAWLARPHRARVEIALATGLYVTYEAGRGLVRGSMNVAQHHAQLVAALERSVDLFWEQSVQRAVLPYGLLVRGLGLAYVSLHLGATILLLIWLYRRHRGAFPLVRTALIVATGLALAIHLAFPTAPPRLAELGLADTVTSVTRVNLSSGMLGALYNPIAAVPSMHFGYALVVGFSVTRLARRRSIRALGRLYPLFVLFVIVATGNHFFLDAAAGAAVTGAAWLAAGAVVCRPQLAACSARLAIRSGSRAAARIASGP
jgi:PAP2 superfamily